MTWTSRPQDSRPAARRRNALRSRLLLEPLEARCLLTSNVLVNDPEQDVMAPNPRNDTQSEAAVIMALDGTLLVAFNDSNLAALGPPEAPRQYTGYALSWDGGASFYDMGNLPTDPNGDAGDPSLARDDATGIIYLSLLPFTSASLQVFRSFDNGFSFQPPVNGAPGQGGLQDKERIVVDNFPGKGQGNVYLVWRNIGSGNGIFFSRSTDYGETFGPSGGTLIASASAFNVQGAYVVVGADHAVYVFWFEQSNPQRIMVRKSTDFGATFGEPVQVTDLRTTGSNGNLNIGPFRTNAYPQAVVNPVTGAIYVVYNDRGQAPDRADVYFRQSSDGGATWSDPYRLNDDQTTNDQWFPALAVTPDGSRVGVFWYDRRLDGANVMIDRYGVIGYVYEDVVYFDVNRRVTDESFPVVVGVDPAVLFNYMGEYDTAAADDYCFYTVWGDNRRPSLGHAGNNADVRFSAVCPSFGPGGRGPLRVTGEVVAALASPRRSEGEAPAEPQVLRTPYSVRSTPGSAGASPSRTQRTETKPEAPARLDTPALSLWEQLVTDAWSFLP